MRVALLPVVCAETKYVKAMKKMAIKRQCLIRHLLMLSESKWFVKAREKKKERKSEIEKNRECRVWNQMRSFFGVAMIVEMKCGTEFFWLMSQFPVLFVPESKKPFNARLCLPKLGFLSSVAV